MLERLSPGEQTMLDISPAALLERLPRAGRVLVGLRSGGAKHERIGTVEAVRADGALLHVTGADHDATLDPEKVTAIALTLGESKRAGLLPQVDIFGEGDRLLMQLMGMQGGADLLDALAEVPFRPGTVAIVPEAPEPFGVPADDIGGLPFHRAVAVQVAIAVELDLAGAVSRWQGHLDEVRCSERFVNVILPSFHLHMRGGAISGWDRRVEGDAAIFDALGPDGAPLGLIVTGPAEIAG